MRLSDAERAALVAVHRGGIEGMRIPGVIMVACSTVTSLTRKGAFQRGGLTPAFAAVARDLSDAEHEDAFGKFCPWCGHESRGNVEFCPACDKSRRDASGQAADYLIAHHLSTGRTA